MRPVSGLLTSLLKPSTLTRAFSCNKASIPLLRTAFDDILITSLRPRNYEDFQTFKAIITNENIVFTSSWINKWFGIDQLKKRCDFMSKKLEMLEAGDSEINLPEDVLEAYRSGLSPTQIALNRFFTTNENKDNLRRIYLEMTSQSEKTGLGYYKFEDGNRELLGGGALAPISEDGKKVDIALHILKPKQGIGSYCLERLLDIAFKERDVDQVWGSSIIEHPGTPTLCAKHGMIIQNITAEDGEKMKYYFIDRRMREASIGKAEEIVRKNPIAASTRYNKDTQDSGRAGR